MTQTLSKEGIQFLKEREGFRNKAYLDGGGVWTIGYGHTGSDVHKDSVITEEQGESLLKDDLIESEDVVNTLVTVPLSNNQFTVLVSFCFNIGSTAFRKSTLLKVLNQGLYKKVPEELKKWNHIHQVVNQGLTNRRQLEIQLWNA